jgi:hypothetical protein
MPASRCKQWQTLKKPSTDAKAKTHVKARAAVRLATMAARVKTPAKAREVAPPKGRKSRAIY